MASAADFIPNAHSVRDLLSLFYGTPFITQPDESDYTVTTTFQILGKSLGQVVGRLLSNTGSTNIAIAYNPGVTITTGFLVLPGGTFEDDWYFDGDLLMRPLYAISSAPGGTLHLLERAIYAG